MGAESLMIIGGQWGDEGKGKVVDLLSSGFAAVVRYNGGNNAGHTVCFADRKFALHLVPSGIIHDGVTCYLGSGMVVDPTGLVAEMDTLIDEGVEIDGRIKLSPRATLILPTHKALDSAREGTLGAGKIGTTGRGIGPCYEDKASRRGIRFIELTNSNVFAERVKSILEEKNFTLEQFLSAAPLKAEEIIDAYAAYAARLAPYVGNVSVELHRSLRTGKQILFEGAQGTHLDIDHGTYPFVTSSNTLSGNACCGAGIGPKEIQHVIGIVKAYTTRVGRGPFPSELFDDIGDTIQEKGAEFGATTGRRRRCGWLDTVILNNAVRLNGLTGLAVTKLDVLGGLDSLNICTGYDYQGQTLDYFPGDLQMLGECKPIYETLPGWSEDISGIRNYNDLPENTKKYLKRIEEIAETPIRIISIGPARDETIILKNPYTA